MIIHSQLFYCMYLRIKIQFELKLVLGQDNQDLERSVIDKNIVTPVPQSMLKINQNCKDAIPSNN